VKIRPVEAELFHANGQTRRIYLFIFSAFHRAFLQLLLLAEKCTQLYKT